MEPETNALGPRIAKLTGSNYRPWSLQIKRYLQARELWMVVEKGPLEGTVAVPIEQPIGTGSSSVSVVAGSGDEPVATGSSGRGPPRRKRDTEPEDPTGGIQKGISESQDAINRLLSPVRDARAATAIMEACSQEALQHIVDLETAKEQWEHLKSLYLPVGTAQLSRKLQAFGDYQPQKGASIAVIARELSNLQFDIGAISPIERPTTNAKIGKLFRVLRGLNSAHYGPMILQLELSGSNKEWETVVAYCTEFELQLKELQGSVGKRPPIEQALQAESPGGKKPKKGGFKNGFSGTCYNCEQKGHMARECPKKKVLGNSGPKKDPSTGPLPTPGGRSGLSPQREDAKTACEEVWVTAIGQQPVESEGRSHLEACNFSAETPKQPLSWLVDSGCSKHMTPYKSAFKEYSRLEVPTEVNTASGAKLLGVGIGSVTVRVAVGGSIKPITITGVLYVPGLAGSLISVLQLQDRGFSVCTEPAPGKSLVLSFRGKTVGYAARIGKSYRLVTEGLEPEEAYMADALGEVSPELLHRRMGHLSHSSLKGLDSVTTGLTGPIKPMEDTCTACILAKAVKVINRAQPERTSEVLGRVIVDWWGPFSVPSLGGATMMLVACDEASRKLWLRFGARRDFLALFQSLQAELERETNLKMKVVRSDNAPEFKATAAILAPIGLKWEFSSLYFQEQVGTPERLNRVLITLSRAMLMACNLPLKFWAEAASTVAYIRNRTPVGPEGKTPEEAYSGKKPYIGHMRVWGCLAYARVPKENRENKLEPVAIQCIFIGYRPTKRQYRLYNPQAQEVIVATAPKFEEDKLLKWNWGSDTVTGDLVLPWEAWEAVQTPIHIGEKRPDSWNLLPEGDTIIVDSGESRESSDPREAEQALEGVPIAESLGELEGAAEEALPGAEREPTEPEQAWVTELQSELFSNEEAYITLEGPIVLPKNAAEAYSDPIHGAEWRAATEVEVTKLQALNTWEVVNLPPGSAAVGCRLVFAVKYTPTGLIDRYKVRVVAQGFSQQPEIDFLETFSPALRQESLRVLLALAVVEDLEILQCDVVSAYPRAQLHATVYVKPPEPLKELLGLGGSQKVFRLNTALYGLKQSGREWYIEACRGLKQLGFEPLFSEPSILINPSKGQIIGLYVDDMLVLGKNRQAVQATVNAIGRLWEIKDLGDVKVILGLRVQRNRLKRTLKIDQTLYIQALLQRFKLQEATPTTLPMVGRESLGKALKEEPRCDQALYQSAIGGLSWVYRGTRLDIAYPVNQLASYCSDPSVRHWNAALRVMRYLKGSINYSLEFGTPGLHGLELQGFCDADYAGDADSRLSTTGALFLLGGAPAVWVSVKQRCVAQSTGESEYIAACDASKIGMWLRGLLRELQRGQYLGKSLQVKLFSDNTACIAMAKDPIAHAKTKHIEVRYHYIRQLVAYGKLSIEHIGTEEMLADILTKPLAITAFTRCISGFLRP